VGRPGDPGMASRYGRRLAREPNRPLPGGLAYPVLDFGSTARQGIVPRRPHRALFHEPSRTLAVVVELSPCAADAGPVPGHVAGDGRHYGGGAGGGFVLHVGPVVAELPGPARAAGQRGVCPSQSAGRLRPVQFGALDHRHLRAGHPHRPPGGRSLPGAQADV
jgi:hypothetical protein